MPSKKKPRSQKKPSRKAIPVKFYVISSGRSVVDEAHDTEREARAAARAHVETVHANDAEPYDSITAEVVKVVGGSKYAPPKKADVKIVDF